jgi:hypothetical protein
MDSGHRPFIKRPISFDTLKTKIHLNRTKFHSYFTENTVRIHYIAQQFSDKENNNYSYVIKYII